MSKIKLKETVKDIKVFDRAADVSTHMKNTFVKSKDAAEQTQDTGYHSPSEYATDNISSNAKSTAEQAARHFKNPHKKAAENWDKAKDHLQNAKRNLPKQRKQAAEQAKQTAEKAKQTADQLGSKAKEAQKTAERAKKAVADAKRTLQQTRQAGRQTVRSARQSVKTAKPAEKTIKTSAKTIKTTGKSSVKAARNTVKTAERTAKTTVKTAKQTAKAAQKSAQAAAKAAKLAAQASKAAAKAAAHAAKIAVKVTIATIKAIIAATKALISAIIAGGWVAVVIILVICMIGLLVGSVFGIFFSGEDSGTGRSMPSVVSEFTTEFYNKAEQIKKEHTHDVVDMDVMSIHWNEVLAVYAVKVNTNPDNAMEVATLDDGKVEKLRDVLNDMAFLSYTLKTETKEQTVTDENGQETTESVTITTLVITLNQKNADDMAVQYGFSNKQKEQLKELLSPDYAELWAQLLGGYSAGAVKHSQVTVSIFRKTSFHGLWLTTIRLPLNLATVKTLLTARQNIIGC